MGWDQWRAERWDAIVVGAGPNGLAAAVDLARFGRSVLLVERQPMIGGGLRSAELTEPGFIHDICAAIHPLAVASPFFRSLPLADYGLRWIFPDAPLAHPLDDGTAVLLERSVADTAAGLGADGAAYARLMTPLVAEADHLVDGILAPLRLPRHPVTMAQFGRLAVRSATSLARHSFAGDRAQALVAGLAAHSFMRLDRSPSAAFGLVLGILGHAFGWPMAMGGSQSIANALGALLRAEGGEIVTGVTVRSLAELPPANTVLLDVSPRALSAIAGDRLPTGYRRRLARYRFGPGVFKVDYALDGPVPWRAQACLRAGTVHLGGTLAEIAHSEAEIAQGRHPERPFVLVAQQSLFDRSRAPVGRETLYAYCHLPHGSPVDMTERIEAQIERFAPGFRDRVITRATMGPAALEAHNPNLVGGDINGGALDWRQLFTRPLPRLNPYRTPVSGLYLCSASTPPGGGTHGMCGAFAARTALRRM